MTEVDVWLICTDLPDELLAHLADLLDEDERRRAATMGFDPDRRRFIAAHGAVRLIVGERVGAQPEALRWRRGPAGKPHLDGDTARLHTNLSHSEDLAVLAVSGARSVGVDVEWLTPDVDVTGLSARFFPPAEARFVAAAAGAQAQLRRFADLWTRKEACVKAAGGRLFQGLQLPVHGRVVRDPGGGVPGEFRVRSVPVPAGFVAAVALRGTAPFRVNLRRWAPITAASGA